MFKFTFNIGSHLFNPFTAQRQATESFERVEREQQRLGVNSNSGGGFRSGGESLNGNGMRRLPAPPQRILTDGADTDASASANAQSALSPAPTPLSRKRGWAPSSSSPSAPLSSAASTNGWLDTPSRYVEAANSQVRENGSYDYQEHPPPAKRRKTIADSILSTALSAALIGTAVGMSAYRMWRDRGMSTSSKRDSNPGTPASGDEVLVDHDHPPPPYEQEDWVHAIASQPKIKSIPVEPSIQSSSSHRAPSIPGTIPRTPKSSRASKARRAARTTTRYRATPASPSPRRGLSPSKAVPPSSSSSYFVNDPDAGADDDARDEFDVQIESMDDKIRRLIEEGQRALGKEVVIMNDDDKNNEDGAVDDGLDGWEDENNNNNNNSDGQLTGLRVPIDRRKKRRQSNANVHAHTINGGFYSTPSSSLPSRLNMNDHHDHNHNHGHSHGHTHSTMRSERSVSPQKGRPRALTGTRRLGSPVEQHPSVQVIYEPLSLAGNGLSGSTSVSGVSGEQSDFVEDQDSLNLSQRMEKIRQAYRLR